MISVEQRCLWDRDIYLTVLVTTLLSSQLYFHPSTLTHQEYSQWDYNVRSLERSQALTNSPSRNLRKIFCYNVMTDASWRFSAPAIILLTQCTPEQDNHTPYTIPQKNSEVCVPSHETLTKSCKVLKSHTEFRGTFAPGHVPC